VFTNGSHVYWVNYSGSALGVWRANIADGSSPTQWCGPTGLSAVIGACTDGTYIYVSQGTGSGSPSVRRYNLSDGSDANTGNFPVGGFGSPLGIATDGTYLYVCDGTTQKIVRMTLAGASINYTWLAADHAGQELETDGTYLWWPRNLSNGFNYVQGSIARAKLDLSDTELNWLPNVINPLGLVYSATPGPAYASWRAPQELYPEDCGAKADGTTDDTGALQEWLDALAYSNRALIGRLSPASYAVSQDPHTTRQGYSILQLPNNGGHQITIIGTPGGGGIDSALTWGQGSRITVTGSNAWGYDATHGSPSVLGGPTGEQLGLSGMIDRTLWMENVLILVPSNPTIGGINCQRIARVNIKNSSVFAQNSSGAVQPTHVNSFGFWMPDNGNYGTSSIEDGIANGMYAGIVMVSSHISLTRVQGFYCVVPYALIGDAQYNGTDPHIGTWVTPQTWNSKYCLAGWDPQVGAQAIPASKPFWIDVVGWDIQDGGASDPAWQRPDATKGHIWDTNNVLQGTATFCRSVSQLGQASGELNVSGGANFRHRDAHAPRGSITRPSVPASGAAFTVQPYDQTYYLTGGTIGSISVDGRAIGLTTPCAVRVPMNKALVITYSVAPSVQALIAD
jgi:hypothetical protein